MVFTFDIPAFRISYPAFADSTAFPNTTLQMYWNNATCYISTNDYGALTGNCRYNALTLMTAHLTALSVAVAAGKLPNLPTSATIDKVTVSYLAPPVKSQWAWWLSLTPYGQQLYALLQSVSVGGFLVGGSPERLAFRRIGRCF